ncbi:MAG TPA: TonB family protein [Candidatus Limnocylindrales bacterium]|nr:TonB family protein [Candidatus Limnocylindrales bacterium]
MQREQTAAAAALAFSLALHGLVMALLAMMRSQPVPLFDARPVPIQVAILDAGTEIAGPGKKGAMLIDGAPPAPAPQAQAAPIEQALPEPAEQQPMPPPVEVPPKVPVETSEPAPKPAPVKMPARKPKSEVASPKAPAASRPAGDARPLPLKKPAAPPTSGPAAPGSTAVPPPAGAASSAPSAGAPSGAPLPPGAIAGGGGSGVRGGTATAPQWAPSARASYEQRFSAWIQRFKQYPVLAQRRHLEGSGRMMIRIDRRGRVVSRAIEQSSGERLLDNAALEMVDRANPFPALPDEYPHETFVVRYSFDFHLR